MVIFFIFSSFDIIFILIIFFTFQRYLVTLSFCLSRLLHISNRHRLSKAETRQGMTRFNPITKYHANGKDHFTWTSFEMTMWTLVSKQNASTTS